MSPIGTRRPKHNWSRFEKLTLLCIIARGIHINGIPRPGDHLRRASRRKPSADNDWYIKQKIHSDVTEAFYNALRDSGVSKVISEKEIINMVLIILEENPTAVEMMKRTPGAQRLTRALKRAFSRNLTFMGQKEWVMDNKEEEEVLKKKQDESIQYSIESLLKDAGNNAGWNDTELRLALGGRTADELTASVAERNDETPTSSQDASLMSINTTVPSPHADTEEEWALT